MPSTPCLLVVTAARCRVQVHHKLFPIDCLQHVVHVVLGEVVGAGGGYVLLAGWGGGGQVGWVNHRARRAGCTHTPHATRLSSASTRTMRTQDNACVTLAPPQDKRCGAAAARVAAGDGARLPTRKRFNMQGPSKGQGATVQQRAHPSPRNCTSR